jgi:hypothetical protein
MPCTQFENELGDGYREAEPLSDRSRTALGFILIAPASPARYNSEARGVCEIGVHRHSSSTVVAVAQSRSPSKAVFGRGFLLWKTYFAIIKRAQKFCAGTARIEKRISVLSDRAVDARNSTSIT